MKITINGSPKELAELLDVLGGMENAEENHELPPLLTELADDEKRNKMANDIQHALVKTTQTAKQSKETALQAEATEQKKNKEIFEKQMKLLSEASEFGTGDMRFPQNLSQLTRAMIDIHKYQGRVS